MRSGASCLEHTDQPAIPCSRCGTFRCDRCLVEGLCPGCRLVATVQAPTSENAVPFGPRAGARVIDLVVAQVAGTVGGAMAGITLALLALSGLGRSDWAQHLNLGFGLNLVVGGLAGVAGHAVSLVVCGTTLGKRLLGLRVVTTDGRRPGIVAAVVRELAWYVDSFFFGLVAFKAMENSPLQQRLGDAWANTVVVRSNTISGTGAASGGLVVVGILLGLAAHALVLGLGVVLLAR